MRMMIKTFATCLMSIGIVAVCFATHATAQLIPESEINDYFDYYQSLKPRQNLEQTSAVGSGTSSYILHRAASNNWGSSVQSLNGFNAYSNGYGVYGGSTYGGQNTSQISPGFSYAPTSPFTTQTYGSGEQLRSDPGGGIGGTILRIPTQAAPQPSVILMQGSAGQGQGGGALRRGPAIPIDTKSMSIIEKRALAAQYSSSVKSMIEKLNTSRFEMTSSMSTMSASELATKQGQLKTLETELDQRVEDLASVISKFSSQSMQTQGIGSVAPSISNGRPTAVEGSNFYYDIR